MNAQNRTSGTAGLSAPKFPIRFEIPIYPLWTPMLSRTGECSRYGDYHLTVCPVEAHPGIFDAMVVDRQTRKRYPVTGRFTLLAAAREAARDEADRLAAEAEAKAGSGAEADLHGVHPPPAPDHSDEQLEFTGL